MQKIQDDSKACPATFVQDSTLVVVIEMGLSSWLVAGMIPGVSREPLKKIAPDAERLLQLLYRWRDEAIAACKEITRIAVGYETGRDSFWLARWLRQRGIDAHVIHATSVAISREHRRAKTDRIDTAMLRRGFLGWLRGEPGHCSMAIVPSVEEEDAKRPHRERDSLVQERTSTVNRMKSILIQFGVRNCACGHRSKGKADRACHRPPRQCCWRGPRNSPVASQSGHRRDTRRHKAQ
jgi:transposase